MPFTPTPLDPERPQPETDQNSADPAGTSDSSVNSGRNAPLSFIPHAPDGSVPSQPVKINTGRYGELDAHELIHLLDTIEDERARGRFRESIYIALFVWMVMAWVVVYGPVYLWHAPALISPAEAMRKQELTVLNAPVLRRAPVALPHPALDKSTIERLRAMTARHIETPAPPPPAPSNNQPMPSNPAPTIPEPIHATPVVPRQPSPILADAPTPQPSALRNNNSFATPSASESMRDLSNAIAGNRDNSGGAISAHGSGRGSPLGAGVEVLSPNPDNVNLDPYLRRMLQQIRDEWIPLIPEEVEPPLSKTGSTLIRFAILPDGRIGAMHLDGSTHDDALNRAAWGAITGVGQFEPLPPRYHQPNLELRIDFEVMRRELQ